MFKRFLVSVFFAAAVVGGVTGCAGDIYENDTETTTSTDTEQYQAPADESDESGGLGFTYTGKPGIELGGGLILPLDGSGISLGY